VSTLDVFTAVAALASSFILSNSVRIYLCWPETAWLIWMKFDRQNHSRL